MTDSTSRPNSPPVPDRLIAEWQEQAHRYGDGGVARERLLIQQGAHWGFLQGFDAGRQQVEGTWPEPITDRAPTKADADGGMQVQYLSVDGLWRAAGWRYVEELKAPWHHTPRWRPPALTLQEQALAILDSGTTWGSANGLLHAYHHTDVDLIRQALKEASNG